MFCSLQPVVNTALAPSDSLHTVGRLPCRSQGPTFLLLHHRIKGFHTLLYHNLCKFDPVEILFSIQELRSNN